jgi:hypothetical protein
MFKYLILRNPGHNRVYYKNSSEVALAELSLTCNSFETECNNIRLEDIAGIQYFTFDCTSEIKSEELRSLSAMSFTFAIFRLIEDNSEKLLLPIEMPHYEYLDTKISSLLKYSGKTNEIFTKMMINVGVLSCDFSKEESLNILDPVAGKGTTLFEGLIHGFDVYGIEIEQKSVHEANVFFKKYLETERYKHDFERRPVSGTSKADAVYIHEYEFAVSKDDFKDSSQRKTFALVQGRTEDADKYFKKDSFHLIIGDLPYGISHGNNSGKKHASVSRNPHELLSLALPAWHKVLKSGGVVVVAWNAFVAHRKALEEEFQKANFSVLSEEPYNNFEHLVDKSIKRDIVVAKKL